MFSNLNNSDGTCFESRFFTQFYIRKTRVLGCHGPRLVFGGLNVFLIKKIKSKKLAATPGM